MKKIVLAALAATMLSACATTAPDAEPVTTIQPDAVPVEATPPDQTTEMPDYNLDPTFGQVTLPGGSGPAPYQTRIVAGGPLSASVVGEGCAGWIARAPDFRVSWTASGDPLAFRVDASADTTLVINSATGDWVCDDDSGGGLSPRIAFEHADAGQYDVWVGSYRQGDTPNSTLSISEN